MKVVDDAGSEQTSPVKHAEADERVRDNQRGNTDETESAVRVTRGIKIKEWPEVEPKIFYFC